MVVSSCIAGHAQGKLSISNVHTALLRNSGAIMENNQTKGYFFFYQSDRINRQKNEYTLQILDQNVNKIIDIRFEDSKRLSLLEAAFNNSSLAFLFHNSENKTLDVKVYDTGGKLKYTYSRAFDKKSHEAMKKYQSPGDDGSGNSNMFDVGEKGYVSVHPVCNEKRISYEVDFYSSDTRNMWTYVPVTGEEEYVSAAYLGSTDSLIILHVLKKNSKESKTLASATVAINFITGKKAFSIESENDGHILSTSNMINLKETGRILLMGNYFDNGDKKLTGPGKGIAVYEVDPSGNVVAKKFNSCTNDIESLYLHQLVGSNGKVFAVAERNKAHKNAGRAASASDLIMIEFDDRYKMTNVIVHNTARSFGYEFTARKEDDDDFTVCYRDYIKSDGYKGQTFNSIRYNGEKFVTDKIKLKSKATRMLVLPAKMGSVMIVEYFKRTRKLQLRIEKMG